MPELSWNEFREAVLRNQADEAQRAANIQPQAPSPTPEATPQPLIFKMTPELKIREPKYKCRNCGRAKLKKAWYCSECRQSMKDARHNKGRKKPKPEKRGKKTSLATSPYYTNHAGLMP